MQRPLDDSRLLRLPLLIALALALPIASACGGDDDDDSDGTNEPDAAVSADAAPLDASGECEPTSVLPANFRPIAEVSEGTVVTTPGDVTGAVIDATAGGSMMQANNPFIYVDLEKGTKAEIDDVEAYDSDAWDIAWKRANIRLNGGDSGTGGVAKATVPAENLEAVKEAPPDGEFATDDWVDENCELIAQQKGTPSNSFGEWYEYDIDTNRLAPKAEVHVIRTRSGTLVKLEIENYYDEENNSAVYTVRWAPL